MKSLLVLLFSSLLLPAFSQTVIHYDVIYSKNMEKDGLTVKVTTELAQPADSTYFHFSNTHWGEENLLNCLTGFSGKKYSFRVVPDSNRIVVYHPKSTIVSFSYRVRQDFPKDDPSVFSRPKVQQAYFHIPAESMFTVPETVFANPGEDPQLRVDLRWTGFPKDYTIHNMFGTGQLQQTLNVRLWSQFYNSVFVGGDYRVHSFLHNGKSVHMAIRGTWIGYTDDELVGTFRNTLTTQRRFWNDDDFDYYTVILTPTVTANDSVTFQGHSMHGTRVHQGFTILSSNTLFNDKRMMRYIFNHEMMHDWIGGKIAMQHEELNYWFSEGFTDYYSFKNRLRSGELNMKEWTELFNTEVLRAHYRNPERNIQNYVIKDDFWKSRDVEKIPYRRGAIFALWLDLEIQRRSAGGASLDDVMRELLLRCNGTGTLFTDELFLSTVKPFLGGEDISYFFQKHVISGVDFDTQQFALPEGMVFGASHDGIPQMELEDAESLVKRRYLLEK